MMKEAKPSNLATSAEAAGGHGLSARLCGIEIESPAPANLAAFYHRAMGFVFEQHGPVWQGYANDRRLSLRWGQRGQCICAWYAVRDHFQLEKLVDRLTGAQITLSSVDLPGLLPGAVCFLDPDGNRFAFGMDAPAVRDDSSRGVVSMPARLQHVVFGSKDAVRFLEFHRGIVGFGLSDRVLDDRANYVPRS